MFDITPFGYKPTNMLKDFDNFERNFFNGFDDSFKAFRTDIEDKGENYLLSAELPGFERKDINVDIDGNMLIIKAEHKEESEKKDKKGNYIRRERRYGSYQRAFDISNVDTASIGAEYKNGVLELTLPKLKEQKANQKRIEIK